MIIAACSLQVYGRMCELISILHKWLSGILDDHCHKMKDLFQCFIWRFGFILMVTFCASFYLSDFKAIWWQFPRCPVQCQLFWSQQPVGGWWCIFVRIYHIGALLPQNIIKMASRQYASRSHLGIQRLLLHVFINTHRWRMIYSNRHFLSYLINYSAIVLIQSSLEIWNATPIRTMS